MTPDPLNFCNFVTNMKIITEYSGVRKRGKEGSRISDDPHKISYEEMWWMGEVYKNPEKGPLLPGM